MRDVLLRTAKSPKRGLPRLPARHREAPEVSRSRILDPEVRVSRPSAGPWPIHPAEVESDLDEATYTCSCGYVFQAAVVTSVGCPHCGDAQAW